MQEKNITKVKKILLALAEYLGVKGIRGLAECLGLPDNNLYAWIKRDSIGDIGSILGKCPNISKEWLETGEGEMMQRPQTVAEQIGEGYRPEVKLVADYLEVKVKGKTSEEILRMVEELMADIRSKYK